MLEKPAIPEARIAAGVEQLYGLTLLAVEFLPLGADVNTAVYHLTTNDDTSYFLKLRQGAFNEAAVALAKFLSQQGIPQIIAPLPTKNGQLWGHLGVGKTILYPFIPGRNGYEVRLSDYQWRELGAALKKIHAAKLPESLLNTLPRESFSPKWREAVRRFLKQAKETRFADPVAQEVAALLNKKRSIILDLIQRAEAFAQILQAKPATQVVCHSDIHAGNIHLAADGSLKIVDWDEAILAPIERDLMYIGGGLLASGLRPEEEEARFYAAYGPALVNPLAQAYFRFERIIQDIAAYCEQLLLSDDGGADREASLVYLQSNFWPDHTIEIACQMSNARSA